MLSINQNLTENTNFTSNLQISASNVGIYLIEVSANLPGFRVCDVKSYLYVNVTLGEDNTEQVVENVALGSIVFLLVFLLALHYFYYRREKMQEIMTEEEKTKRQKELRRLAQANTFDRKLEDVPAHKAALIRRKLSKESRERSSIIKHLRNNTLPRSSVLEEETSQMWTNEKMSMKERLEMAANVTDNVISKLAHMGSSSSSDGTYSTGRSSVGSQTDMDEVNSDDSFPQHNNAPTFKFDKDESDEEEVMLN